MNRLILVGSNKDFPRASAAATNSGAVPGSLGGGAVHSVEPHCPPRGAGPSSARRPTPSLLKAVAAVALWDSGQFNTAQIAHVLGMKEARVADVLHFMREERRARR